MSRGRRITEVALLIDTEDLWGRDIISGIAKAVRGSLPWRLTIAPRDEQWRLRVPPKWQGQGLITSIRDQQTAEHVESLNCPVVNVSTWGRNLPWASHVTTHDRRRAELAYEHLRAKGFERFAFYAPRALTHLRNRGHEFAKLVQDAGCSYSCFFDTLQSSHVEPERAALINWLKQLRYPIAILAANPLPALQLTEVCRELEIRVPHEVAVLACDTDDMICEVADPPISSIELACQRLGGTAVEELRELMRSKTAVRRTLEVEPLGVIERQSTAALAFGDTLFVQAVEYLRSEATKGINVANVLRAVPISRRALEQQFVRILGTSPAAEIRRIRIDLVKRLLRDNEFTIKEIANQSGFTSTSQMGRVFSKEVGLTPTEFRERGTSR